MFMVENNTLSTVPTVVVVSQSSQQMNGQGGEGGGGAGGGDEDPSRLRVEKVGISALPKDIIRRLPEVGGGDRRWQSG